MAKGRILFITLFIFGVFLILVIAVTCSWNLFGKQSVAVETTPQISTDQSGEAAASSQRVYRPSQGSVYWHFGWQLHPAFHDWRYHNGCDLLTEQAAPVQAMWAGTVTEVCEDKRRGLTLVIESGERQVRYESLSQVFVTQGKAVAGGETIGLSGSCQEEPYIHLHITIKVAGRLEDPDNWL